MSIQISGILKPKRRVLVHNPTVRDTFNAFEVELDGSFTVVIPEGTLKDEIIKANGVGIVAQLTPSGTLDVKFVPLAQLLTADELEERAQEADELEIENRKKHRLSEQKLREETNKEKLKDQARLSLTEKARLDAEKASETTARNNAFTASSTPNASVNDEDLEKEMERLKTLNEKSLNDDPRKSISPILADLDEAGNAIPNEEHPVQEDEDEETTTPKKTTRVQRVKTKVRSRLKK